MPIYEYRCDACGHELEKIQRMSDAPLTDCPDCGADRLRRLVSAPGFRLKGGGWYETDFKKDGRRNLADAGDKPADKPAAKPVDAPAKEKPAATESKKAADKPASPAA